MIAQDTGSAIIGPARGDIFFGSGTEAGAVAGRIRHSVDFVILRPVIQTGGGRLMGNDRTSRRTLTKEERELWSRVTRDMTPNTDRDPVDTEPPEEADDAAKKGKVRSSPVKPGSRTNARPMQPSIQVSAATVRQPGLAPIDRRTIQRLARGAIDLDGRIDLHGLTQNQAHTRLMAFLRQAQQRNARMVLVITGKGRTDDGDDGLPGAGRGVLRRAVPQWLQQPEFRALVSGIQSAHNAHGGDGAFYVRIRRRRPVRI